MKQIAFWSACLLAACPLQLSAATAKIPVAICKFEKVCFLEPENELDCKELEGDLTIWTTLEAKPKFRATYGTADVSVKSHGSGATRVFAFDIKAGGGLVLNHLALVPGGAMTLMVTPEPDKGLGRPRVIYGNCETLDPEPKE
ncbi:MAG: hypothetical protein ACPGNV_08260 [Mangrovicoccus sp.]